MSFVLTLLLLYLGEHIEMWWWLTRPWCYTCNHRWSVKSLSNHCCMVALGCNKCYTLKAVCRAICSDYRLTTTGDCQFIHWCGHLWYPAIFHQRAFYTCDSLPFSTPAHFSWTMYKLITTGHRQLILIQKNRTAAIRWLPPAVSVHMPSFSTTLSHQKLRNGKITRKSFPEFFLQFKIVSP